MIMLTQRYFLRQSISLFLVATLTSGCAFFEGFSKGMRRNFTSLDDQEILASNEPIGTVGPFINGKAVAIYDAYGLHDDYLKFRAYASLKPGFLSWKAISTHWQVDGGSWHDFDDCVTPLYQKITDCKWKNPRDGQIHNIVIKAYFGKIKPKRDSDGSIVYLENNEMAMDTLIHNVPAKYVMPVLC